MCYNFDTFNFEMVLMFLSNKLSAFYQKLVLVGLMHGKISTEVSNTSKLMNKITLHKIRQVDITIAK